MVLVVVILSNLTIHVENEPDSVEDGDFQP
jgi:hypothetical protein